MSEDHANRAMHPSEAMLAAYALSQCNQAEQLAIDEHCFACERCRARLTILMRVCTVEERVTEPQLKQVFPLSLESLTHTGHQAEGTEVSSPPKSNFAIDIGSQPVINSSGRKLSLYFRTSPRYWMLALALLTVFVMGAVYYGVSLYAPEDKGLMALRRSYRNSRPLEARVTGDFSYQPFERKRGEVEMPGIDRDQLNYALAEMTRAVALQPTGETRHALGRLYLLMGDFKQAEEQMLLALSGLPRNAKLHSDLATLYYERSKYAEPLPLYSKAIDHYRTALEIEPRLAEAWFNLALCYEQMALFGESRKSWERYLEIDSQSAWAVEARARLQKMDSRAGPADVRRNVQVALQNATTANDRVALQQLVGEHYVTVKQIATEQLFDEYLKATLADDTATASARLQTLKLIGDLAAESKDDRFIADAIDFAARASPAVKQRVQESRLALRQAAQEFTRSSYDASFKFYSQALRAAESIGDQCHAEIASLQLAYHYILRADSTSFFKIGNKLLADADRLRHRQIQAKILLELANVYLRSLQTERALECSLRATEIAVKLSDTESAITGLRFSGAAYTLTGDYERAIEKNFAAVAQLRNHQSNASSSFMPYYQLAETLFQMRSYNRALDYQLEMQTRVRESKNPMFLAGTVGRLGLIYWKLGREQEAKRLLDEALTYSEKISDLNLRALLEADLYTTIGDFLVDQNQTNNSLSSEAISAYQTALKTTRKANSRIYLSAIRQGLARAYLAQGKLAEAEVELKASIALAERDRQQINDARSRSLLLASRQNVYRTMTDFQFVTKQDQVQAFNYAEIAKSRDLLDLLSNARKTQAKPAQLQFALARDAQPLKLRQVQQALPEGTQVITYAVTEERLFIWLLKSQDLFSTSMEISADRLQQLVTSYLRDLRAQQNIALLNSQASELYEILIAPVAAKLDSGQSLHIVTDGVLAQLPFSALKVPGQNRYLTEDFALVVNPSASVLVKALTLARRQASMPRTAANESFFGLSNPRFSREQFPGLPVLPAADEEVNKAKSFYTQAQTVSREQATERALVKQMSNHQLVHIATHVLVNSEAPSLSTIVLARENIRKGIAVSSANDGALRAHEISHLRLPSTRLVILSGCRSAVGDYTRGEALSALAQGFFAAGVPAVVASLWDVDDDSTAALMQAFHFQHRVKQKSFAAALSEAQRTLIKAAEAKQQHPYYWAAFALLGNGASNSMHLD